MIQTHGSLSSEYCSNINIQKHPYSWELKTNYF